MADLTTFGEPLPAALPVPSAVYTACMAYLLTWKLILSLIAQASPELRPKYPAFLRKNNFYFNFTFFSSIDFKGIIL